MKQYVITFNSELDDSQNVLGMKIFDKKSANDYLKAVKKLAQEGITFIFGNEELPYDVEDFSLNEMSNSDKNFISKYFDASFEVDGNSVGIFPDALNDAYENDLLDDEENEDEFDEDDE